MGVGWLSCYVNKLKKILYFCQSIYIFICALLLGFREPLCANSDEIWHVHLGVGFIYGCYKINFLLHYICISIFFYLCMTTGI